MPAVITRLFLVMPGARRMASVTVSHTYSVEYAACPLGNADPDAVTRGSGGRGRSVQALMPWTSRIVAVIPTTSTQNSIQRRDAARATAARAASGQVTQPEPRYVSPLAASVSQVVCRSWATLSAVWSPGVGPGSP